MIPGPAFSALLGLFVLGINLRVYPWTELGLSYGPMVIITYSGPLIFGEVGRKGVPEDDMGKCFAIFIYSIGTLHVTQDSSTYQCGLLYTFPSRRSAYRCI